MPRPACLLLLTTLAASVLGTPARSEDLPPVRQITHGPKFHWFGYYDKLEFDPTSRYVLSNEVDFEGRSPTADDVIRVGMIDLGDHDKWIELGKSRAWSWQQGCMLQWRPGSKSEVVWNDREGDQFVCRILDVFTRKMRTIPMAIYTLSPDGRHAIAADFRRIQDHRPGYGYAGLPDPCKDQAIPETSGVWSVDLDTGESKLIVSIAKAAAIAYENGDPEEFKVSRHWFNHLLYNTDGTRLLFLHRWRPAEGSKYADKYRRVGGFGTRMFTANTDGSGLCVLDPNGKTSHFVWKDPHTVTAWAWHPSDGDRFYDFKDQTREVSVVGRDVMAVNGHNTYLAHTNNTWILNDTYPDRERLQNPYLYHVPTNRRIALGHFLAPREYKGEWRCDTHPRSDPSGTKVVIDSTHNGGRQLYLIDIRGIVSPGKQPATLPTVDLSGDTARQVVIAKGTDTVYQGHPTTVLLPDGKTMLCVWTIGHGGTCGPMKRSNDGGRTWSELLPVPESWAKVKNCPAIYRLPDPQGKMRLFVFASTGPDGNMHQAVSENDGQTWSEMKTTGLQCVMPFCTVIPIEGGKKLLGMTNTRRPDEKTEKRSNVVTQSVSTDGGVTWSPWRIVCDIAGRAVCEPALVRSPDGKQLLCLMRENAKSESMFMTSDDEGQSWSPPKRLPAGLVGDRHMPCYSTDGRLVVCMRDKSKAFGTFGHFVAWVGRYDDIVSGRDGQYRIKLLHSFAGGDCGYPGLEILPDRTFVATTYIKYRPGTEKHSVVSTRFKLEETDKQAQAN